MTIPDDHLGAVLDAVARQRADAAALELGVSKPALVQAALRAAQDPDVCARYPVVCRRILDRQEAAREQRSARHLSVRAEV